MPREPHPTEAVAATTATDAPAPAPSPAPAPAPAPAGARASRRRTVFGTGIGNALEWYDWNIYAVFTPFFAPQFFPGSDPASALMATLAIFAVGFLMRPLGGLVFGRLSDRKGRRIAMIVSVGLASAGSLVIGLAPTHATIGVGASVLLLVTRLVQGLAHGGELPAAQTYVSEMAPHGRRGRWSSLIYVSGTCGIVVGEVLAAILAGTLSEGQLHSWGWRVPFLVGGLIGAYALVTRMRLAETEAFENQRKQGAATAAPRASLWRDFRANRRACLRVVGITLGGTVTYYTWVVSAPAQAIAVKDFDPEAALWAGVLANLVFIAVLPLFGILSDRVGRKPVMLLSYVGILVLTFPLDLLIRDQVWQLGVAMTIAMLFIAASSAILPTVYAEMFPTGMRTAGVAVPYAFAVAACGGSAAYLQTWLGSQGLGHVFLLYTMALLLLAVVVIWRMPETKDVELT
ncbi:MFS transporter [Streptomyces sp. B-S-A8]|uniref:MFS transporter n=1 Tax=Streptomyces solicavernae TaxID=3043614 RepID=A0ABT6RVJ4_9ACTN|nr:MFS transporter [Streptomyces sp. B-S-A8]MDI3387758.1 MFS transporter [Streptomyces sp. B-S-A8]